jgi:hypothetical protein
LKEYILIVLRSPWVTFTDKCSNTTTTLSANTDKIATSLFSLLVLKSCNIAFRCCGKGGEGWVKSSFLKLSFYDVGSRKPNIVNEIFLVITAQKNGRIGKKQREEWRGEK